MIRTLLVDDEPIVRKGLLHILPWERHGMRVVADVGGGEQALQVLEREQVDLPVTDLSMPGMSGFELIQNAQSAHPELNIAILTCHQDFQYIQEALRRGVLDYIVKTELDEEKLDELFARMASRLAAKTSKEPKAEETGKPAPGGREAVLFVGLAEGCVPNELYKVPQVAEHFVTAIGSGCWMIEAEPLPAEWDEEAALALRSLEGEPRWLIVRLHHASIRHGLKEAASRYVRRHAFYAADWTNGAKVVHDSLRDMKAFEDANPEPDWLARWTSFEWVFDSAVWEELLRRIREQRPEPGTLCGELADTARVWRVALRDDGLIGRIGSLRTWSQWKEWLTQCRAKLAAALETDDAGKELAVCMLRAMRISLQRLEDNLTQKELSSLIHLSRGYFSESFKKIVGLTFNDYMRGLRVDTAKRLLATTELDVPDIAKSCGFADETYFRKLFREETGLSIKEWRDQANRSEYALACLGADGRQMSETE